MHLVSRIHNHRRLFVSSLGLLAATLAGSAAHAQVVPYVSSQYSAPYVAITGGTPVPVISRDDGAASVPIGFSFQYYGQSYEHVTVGVNGVMLFANTCPMGTGCQTGSSCSAGVCTRSSLPTFGPNPPNAGDPDNLIAVWWDDLIMNTTNAPVSTLTYQTTGTAPNREFVVQWENIRQFPTSSSGSSVSMQVRLQENSGLVLLHYGTFMSGTDNTSWGGVIGIENQDGTAGVSPVACSSASTSCQAGDLTALANQVIQLGQVSGPELVGSVTPPTGANPGDQINIDVQARNIGTQTTSVAFSAEVYLTPNATINPMTDLLLGSVNFSPVGARSNATQQLITTVPMLMSGYYTIGVVMDSSNAVNEAVETNNISTASNRFLVGTELSVAVNNPVVIAPPGQVSSLAFRILNQGSAAPAVGWDLHLSTDMTLDPMDMLVAQGTTAVPAQPETTVTATVTLPSSLSGTFYLIARVDPANSIQEADENNNVASSTQFMVGAELTVSSIRTVPSMSGPGARERLRFDLRNTGSEVGDVVWRVLLSQDRVLDQFDVVVQSGTVAMGRQRDVSVDVMVTIPSVPPDPHTFVVVVDPDNRIGESNEMNNSRFATSSTDFIGPDIVAAALSGGSIYFRGQSYTVAATLRNDGGAVAQDFYYTFYLSDNQLITASDFPIAEIGPITLDPMETIDVQHTFTATGGIMGGMYHLGIIADSTSRIPEGSREANNIRRMQNMTVEVRDPAPDLRITELRAPRTAAAGETITLQRTIENIGNDTGVFDYGIFLSRDMVYDPSDIQIARPNQTIAAFSNNVGVDTVRIPALVPAGPYFVVYALDPDNAVDEIDETNNVLSAMAVTAVEAASLSIQTTSLPLATLDLQYDVLLAATGGTGSYNWTWSSSTAPAGLTLDAASGRISGVPNIEGTYRVRVTVSDGSLTAARFYGLLVTGPTIGLNVVTRGVPPAWLGRRYEYPLTALGGVQPYKWTTANILPRGVTLSEEGVLSGVPVIASSGIITFRVTDATGAFDERPLALRVIGSDDAVRFAADTLNSGVVGRMYNQALRAVNGVTPYFFSTVAADGSDLPPGITLDGPMLSGVPTAVGTYEFGIRVTDSRGDFDVNRYVIEITTEDSLRFVTTGLPPGTEGVDYVDGDGDVVRFKALSPTNNASIKFTIAAGELPPGLTLAEDGTLSGKPTAAGVYDFLVMAADDQGQDDVGAFGISVRSAPTPEPPPPPTDSGGCVCVDSPRDGFAGLWLFAGLIAAVVVRRRR